MYVAINTDDNTSNGFYVIKFLLEAYRLQNNTTYKLFLLVNPLPRHNIFAPYKKTPIGIGKNNHCNIPL